MADDRKSNVIDQPAKAGEDSLNMKAYADALTAFVTPLKSFPVSTLP